MDHRGPLTENYANRKGGNDYDFEEIEEMVLQLVMGPFPAFQQINLVRTIHTQERLESKKPNTDLFL